MATTVERDNDGRVRNKKLIFKNKSLFKSCISKMNKTFIDDAKDLDIVMPMYNVLEYRDNYYMTFVELLKSWNKWWLERNWW